jgi:hypothetical protein
MRRTRWPRRAGSSSLKTSSSSSSGGRPSRVVRTSSSASLSARMAVRCWPARRERGQVAAVRGERQVVAVRPDQRGAVPNLLVGRLASCVPASRGASRRGAGVAFAHVARGRGALPAVRSHGGRRRAARPATRAAAFGPRRWPRPTSRTARPRAEADRGRPRPRESPAASCCAAAALGCTWPCSPVAGS